MKKVVLLLLVILLMTTVTYAKSNQDSYYEKAEIHAKEAQKAWGVAKIADSWGESHYYMLKAIYEEEKKQTALLEQLAKKK